jgi:hypothetical protein
VTKTLKIHIYVEREREVINRYWLGREMKLSLSCDFDLNQLFGIKTNGVILYKCFGKFA